MKKYYVFTPLMMVIEAEVMERILTEEYQETQDSWYLNFLEMIKRGWDICYAPEGTFEVELWKGK